MSFQSTPPASPLRQLRHCLLILVLALVAHAAPVAAAVQAYPPTFRAQQMEVSGGTQFVRIGGAGPAYPAHHGEDPGRASAAGWENAPVPLRPRRR